jgi:hypothetical protein
MFTCFLKVTQKNTMDRYLSIRRLIKVSTFLFFLSATSVFAQDEGFFTISLEMLTDLNSISNQIKIDTVKKDAVSVYYTESADVELTSKGVEEKEVAEIPSYYRHHKSLDKDFTGFAIELLESNIRLERNFPLFERFGNIHVQQLENGKYSYCIIANFKKSDSLKIFVNEVIIPHAPEAKVLKFKGGKRKKM